ncbi:hypothetical protein WA026_006517 [Henosepilachna vigintioctopunctata]|uniref:Small ribosomal subunit protein uS15m n=1 Tax=Henosepilachna vigintioctopunctata TaxID=420089 RepID=A0AAW1U704_9CUCU
MNSTRLVRCVTFVSVKRYFRLVNNKRFSNLLSVWISCLINLRQLVLLISNFYLDYFITELFPFVMNSFRLLKLHPIKTQFREYALKSDLKIKWVRPEKIPCFKPEKSGDLETFPEIDKKLYQEDFKNCKELKTANELVKKLFTLEFAPRNETVRHYINRTSDKVRRHVNDYGSHEATIAAWTGVIRAMQESMERLPRNKIMKVQLKELIDRRKKFLKYLRRWDYKRFEWLLETLNLKYVPMPLDVHWITRKDSLTKLTDKYCDDIRKDKLEKLKLQLQSEQPAFLEEKIRILEFIRNEQKSCNVEVTVHQDEIDNVKRRLDDLKEKVKQLNQEEI